MPTLFFYVPFPRSVANGDIRTNANDAERAGTIPQLNANVRLVFLGEEHQAMNQVGQGDFVFVHGHGGPDDSDVGNNLGNEITMDDLRANLETMNAQNAVRVYFFICYSARQGHVAADWKQRHGGEVMGCNGVGEGSVVSMTRSRRVLRSIFDGSSGQLTVV